MVISIVLALLKASFLRSLGSSLGCSGVGNNGGSKDVWGKMDGVLEQTMEVGLVSLTILACIKAGYMGK